MIRYEHEAGVAVFPVGFDYGKDSDVAVRLVLPTGLERELEQGKDYILADGNVIYVLPKGHSLLI